ncbi:zinc-dependent metalloprotease family protein [Flavobacterium paronense]|uniref:Reprolysin-like metallopeptidase n=1 Tax=Flavobacterium paronense TaxID=1392775 RepID=A0ABV5GE82_9FLAO|nr:zinc-dependent metalloprotease family protein [Flavobacterium paronense]MDN3678257.1 zinc-dependent metalloprotease family protein [Flavobacterium paronense]
MKKILLLVVFLFSVTFSFSQRDSSWKLLDNNKAVTSEKIRQTSYSVNQKLLEFNAAQFKQSLANVQQKASGNAGIVIQLPNVNGDLEKFQVWESSNFEPALQAKYPEIRAYVGKGITDPSAVLNFSLSPRGIQTMVFRADIGTEFIEPYTKDSSVYVIFDSATRTKGKLPFTCSTEDIMINQSLSNKLVNSTLSNTQSYKTMKLALSCTGEYAVYHGGTVAGALAAMNATMTRCNGVYEKDLAVKLLIIANDDLVIYTDAASDPYSDAANMANWNAELQANLTSVITEANYDIGHLFGASGGGGNAGCVGCVCVNGSKGSGITSPANDIPEGDTFDIDYVAHEMGHQMGGNHTFTHTTENNTVNVEPGSGSTIMAYAGIGGGGTDMQMHSDDYYHYKSILQIQTNLGTKTCPVSTSIALTNPKPVVTVSGAAYTIPVSTAFKLSGTGTGTIGEVLTYCWEQNNDATAVGGTTTFPSSTKTDGPNFRSRPPSASSVRYFPQFSDVLAGYLVTKWETVSSVARSLAFAFTVRDNVLGGGQTNSAATTVTVVDAGGAFAITNPSTANTLWTPGTTQTITWNVAGTTGSGINTANVNILLSTDGGATFPTVLAASTANDGSETIMLPSVAAPTCRILIEAIGNVFYAVSKNIALGYAIDTTCNTYTNSTALVIPDGAGAETPGTVASNTINVPVSGIISDVNIGLNVTHTYPNDLLITITNPSGKKVAVWERACAGNNNFNVTLNDGSPDFTCVANMAGSFSPSSPLYPFNGDNSNGLWTLSVSDYYTGDTGRINSWSIQVCTDAYRLETPTFGFTDFAVYPNPNNGNFNIQFTNNSSNGNGVKVLVHDMRGRVILGNNFENSATFNQNIQLNNAQAGVYLLTVTDGEIKQTKKIVVE